MAACVVLGTPSGATASEQGRSGTLDPSFGDGGRVIAKEPMETAPSEFVAAARAPGGEIVLDLRRHTLTDQVREIEMRLASGAPDLSFGDDGRVAIEDGDGLATLGNGNIVVGVHSCGDRESGSVIELDPSGAAVPGFGRGECGAALPFAPQLVAADAQGRILVAGSIEYCESCSPKIGIPTEVAVARLLPDGGPDPSFGKDGVVRTHAERLIGAAPLEMRPAITGVAATGDGGLIVSVGPRLLRLDEAGAPVTGFGDGGTAAVPGNAAVFYPQPAGDVVVASAERSGKEAILVSRLGPDGKPDMTFGLGGTTALSLPSPEVTSIAPAPGGGIMVAGRRSDEEGCRPCAGAPIVARLTATGQPDPTYGAAGVLDLPQPALHGVYAGPSHARALLVGSDGSALAAGNDQNEDALAVALDPAGNPSPAFADAGTLVEHHEVPAQLEATGVALGPKGEFTVGARRSTAPGLRSGFLLGFGPSGKQRPGTTKGGSVETLSHGKVEPDGGGRVVIWGGESHDRTLRAVRANGEPVRDYGKNGVARLPRGFIPQAVAPAPAGGVAVVGAIGPRAMAVYRLGPRGRPVRKFGHDGLARMVFPRGSAIAFDGLVENDGDVVLTGWVNGHVGTARLLPNGRLDRSFGHGGLVLGLLRKGTFGLLIAPWSRGVVIATMRKGVNPTAQGMIRLDRHGRLVRNFGRRGVVDPADENPALALLTGGGRIVVVTDPTFERNYRSHGVKLRAYRPDGAIDRGFGRGGLTAYGRSTPGKRHFEPAAAVVQPDGRIVLAGTSHTRAHTKLELVGFR